MDRKLGAIQVGWGPQWESLANAINSYYGGGVGSAQYQQVVNMLNSGNYTMEEMEAILGNIPEFNRTYNSAGELINVSYKATTSTASSSAASVAQQVNSNVASNTKAQFGNVQTITKDVQTGKVTISDNVIKYKTGQVAPTTMKSVPISIFQGVAAAATGITLGKVINQAAYDHGVNWLSWAGVDMESLNPETWSSITSGDDSTQAKLFNMILGIDPDTGNPQPYIDERTLAYMTAYMGAIGVFNDDPGSVTPPEGDPISIEPVQSPIYLTSEYIIYGLNAANFAIKEASGCKLAMIRHNHTGNIIFDGLFASDHSGTIGYYGTPSDISTPVTSEMSYTYDNKTVYWSLRNTAYPEENIDFTVGSYNTCVYASNTSLPTSVLRAVAWVLIYGEEHHSGGEVPGIDSQEGATQFNASGISDWTDIATILAALKLQFPNLWDERVEVSPDGDNVITYVPVGFPTGGVGQYPTTNGATQSDLAPDISDTGDNVTDELIKTLIDAIQHPQESGGMESNTSTPTKPVDPNLDPRGTGTTPPIVPPVGSASALWKIYNPSQAQLDTFGAWLWSSNFVDQLLKLFNDPMQAIIGLHKVYCTPSISGSGPIKVGYLVSDANANYVSNQYAEIDCGDVSIEEYFNNAFDYDGFTRVCLYLPFIGFIDLDVKDVMRGVINIKYGVDVLTGACLAKVSVKRDLNDPILYTYSGNCAVQYPVSSGSYMGVVASIATIGASAVATIASGGAAAPLAASASVAMLFNSHADIKHSGAISANAGVLGPKKPYIVIQRPQTHMPVGGNLLEGVSQNETVSLGSLTGYVKVKKADLMGIPATGSELDEIRDLLENGIYME